MFNHILVPIDGSETSMLAVSKASGLALAFGSRITLIHVIDNYPFIGVGADYALGQNEYLAAATSTGGVTNKQVGRVGDTPVIGAGCYADDVAAVSATGTGEMFIRTVAAHDVAAQMRYAGLPLEEAARRVVMEKLPAINGRGGLIAVDRAGNVTLPFNTEGMYRGFARVGETVNVSIYG